MEQNVKLNFVDYLPFLLSDFLRLTASAYLLARDQGWHPYDGFRQVKKILILEKKSAFLEESTQIAKDFFDNPKANIDMMTIFIDKYLSSLSNFKKLSPLDKMMVININFRNQNNDIFYNQICSAILENSYLSLHFSWGQQHNYKSIFKYKYCLIFSKEKENYNEVKLMKELYWVLKNEGLRITNLSIINSAYVYDIVEDEYICKKIENSLQYFNKYFIHTLKSIGEFDSNKIFILAILTSISLITAFQVENRLINSLANYLKKKWIPYDYMTNLKFGESEFQMKKLEKEFDITFSENKSAYEVIYNEFTEGNTNRFDEIDLRELSTHFYSLVDTINKSTNKLSELATLTVAVNDVNAIEKRTFWYIAIILEMFFDSIAVDINSRSYLAHILGRLYKYDN